MSPQSGRAPRLRGHPGPGQDESRGTAVLALVANLGVAVAKGVAAVLTGSAAMVAETFHSIADVANECLLLLGVHRSERPADPTHPRGYGRERYFWSLLAAIGIFLAGGLASVAEGIDALRNPRSLDHVGTALVVLAVSAVLEGASWLKARRQVHDEADDHQVEAQDLIDVTSDPTPVTVFLEDSAALWGLGLAAVGVLGHQLTGQPRWDAAAGIGVGLLLMWIAVRLVILNRRLLLSPSVQPAVLDHVTSVALAEAWVLDVTDTVVVYVGPGTVSVALDVEADTTLTAEELVLRLSELRQDLIDHAGVATVAITLVPADASRTAGRLHDQPGFRPTRHG
jgi:cation diffusion facilitator family transporter